MDKPLSVWYCDTCGERIEDYKRGYVIWHSNEQGYKGFKIIHQGRCDRNDHFASQALEDFLGDDGLARLLSYLSPGPIMRDGGCKVIDMDEFVDFFRRVQVPYYEQARLQFRSSQVQDDHNESNRYYPYQKEQLIDIVGRS